MSQPDRTPRIGDIVLYYEAARQDIWDPPQMAARPAIVTEVLAIPSGAAMPPLRLTVFRPFEKPHWDLTAPFAAEPTPHHWCLRDPVG
jgi:hypothetical protein